MALSMGVPFARITPLEERWTIADELLAAFLRAPITPTRQRRLEREKRLGATVADIQMIRERVYDSETNRLLRDMRAVEEMGGKTA